MRELGEVWRSDFTSPKPWKVQGPGAVASFRLKKHAKSVGELFKKEQDLQLERLNTVNPRTNYSIDCVEFAD